ncbi:MAG: T9SS type A sorting domain-containing protein [bacterium]
MKRLITLIILTVIVSTTYCQLPNGSIAPDFTLKDIDGNTRHLYDYLDSGKVVVIDFFEVLCGPCWIYHETHALAHAFNVWGPQGTNQLMVFEVEGIKSSVNQIKGLANPTKGNWTDGEPFPFIATCAPNGDKIVKDYTINFFPTVYMICRDRRIKLIGTADTAMIHARLGQCPVTPADSLFLDLLSIDSIMPVTQSKTVHPILQFQNYGTNLITSAKISATIDNLSPVSLTWSGNLKTYDALHFDGNIFSQVTDGSHIIRYLVTELNGQTTGFKQDTISIRFTSDQVPFPVPFTQNFTDPVFPYNKWTINNAYKNVPTWERAELGYANSLRIPYFNILPDYTSELYMPCLSFAGNDKPCMRFDLSCTHNNSVIRQGGYDLIEFDYSLNCGNTWQLMAQISSLDHQTAPDDSTYFIPTETQWKPMYIDLTKIAGRESVLVRLATSPAYGNNMYLRNIRFDNTAGINDEAISPGIHVYPVPATDVLYLKLSRAVNISVIELFDITGAVVLRMANPAGREIAIPIAQVSRGLYFLRILSDGYISVRKVQVE